jgi:hypothetical protein
MKLSWTCEEQLFQQELESADDIRLSIRLFSKCLPDKRKVRPRLYGKFCASLCFLLFAFHPELSSRSYCKPKACCALDLMQVKTFNSVWQLCAPLQLASGFDAGSENLT